MTRLFNRSCIVEVGDTRITGLRCAFKVEKSLAREPNTLDLQVWNLSEDTRKRVQQKHTAVRILAGYVDRMEQVFTGDALVITHSRQGPDWVTHLQSGDGTVKMRSARAVESFAPGTSLGDALRRLAQATGLALGNVLEKVATGNVKSGVAQLSKGLVVTGPAIDEVEKLAATMGYRVSVQDGALQLIEESGTTGGDVVDLRPDTGLVGSPEVGEKGVVKARALIQQRLTPGRRLHLASRALVGFYRVEKVTFVGDTHADPWYADLELKPVRAAA